MTDVDIVFPGPVEEPVEDKQSQQRPDSEGDEDEEDTDTDDGAVGENKDNDGS